MTSGALGRRPALPGVLRLGRSATMLAGAAGIAFAAVAVEVVAPRAAPVWFPVLAATLVLFTFYEALGGDGRLSSRVFEIGFVYASAVWLYTCYPLVGFAVNGLAYGPLNDLRLTVADPTPAALGRIGWMYVVHLIAFVVAYSWCRGESVPEAPAEAGRLEGLLLLALVVATQAYSIVLGWLSGWHFTANVDRYVALANLPRFTAQVTGHVDGIRLTAEIGLLAFLFQRYRTCRPWIFGWLAVTAVKTFVERQSRMELVLLCVASAILYDAFVRRVKVYRLVGLAVAGLVAFNLLGVRRMETEDVRGLSGFGRLFVANEFETLFANAYDLDERARAGTLEPPGGIRTADALALVPQQLLATPKVSPADWYIGTFYPAAAAAGVNYCFGSVSESIVSGGWLDLVLRGGGLGVVVGLLRRGVERRKAKSFWWFLFGVWLSVLVYHSFRNTTFTFVAMGWYRFLPVVLAVGGGSWLVKAVRGRKSPARQG